jgi:hypothetical protein
VTTPVLEVGPPASDQPSQRQNNTPISGPIHEHYDRLEGPARRRRDSARSMPIMAFLKGFFPIQGTDPKIFIMSAATP